MNEAKTYRISTAFDSHAELITADCGTRLSFSLPACLLPVYNAAVAAHQPGKTTLEIELDAEDIAQSVSLKRAAHRDPRHWLARAYLQDAQGLDICIRLNGGINWLADAATVVYEPRWISPEHLTLSGTTANGQLMIAITGPDGVSLPADAENFRIMVLDCGGDCPLYDTGFSPAGIVDYLEGINGNE